MHIHQVSYQHHRPYTRQFGTSVHINHWSKASIISWICFIEVILVDWLYDNQQLGHIWHVDRMEAIGVLFCAHWVTSYTSTGIWSIWQAIGSNAWCRKFWVPVQAGSLGHTLVLDIWSIWRTIGSRMYFQAGSPVHTAGYYLIMQGWVSWVIYMYFQAASLGHTRVLLHIIWLCKGGSSTEHIHLC